MNVPFGGYAAFNAAFVNWIFSSGLLVGKSGPSTGGLSSLLPGTNESGINGAIGLANWTFYEARNTPEAFGVGAPCTQPQVAAVQRDLICGTVGNLSTILPLADNFSDAMQIHSVPAQPCSSGQASANATVGFDTSYEGHDFGSPPPNESLRLCGSAYGPALHLLLTGPASIPIYATMNTSARVLVSLGGAVWTGLGADFPSAEYSLPSG